MKQKKYSECAKMTYQIWVLQKRTSDYSHICQFLQNVFLVSYMQIVFSQNFTAQLSESSQFSESYYTVNLGLRKTGHINTFDFLRKEEKTAFFFLFF